LSHVYVQGDWLKATVENVNVLHKPEELFSDRHEDLPKTVYDAINLLGIIGELYLWVDSLCIVQDELLRPPQLQLQKTSIFAHVELVIIASDGSNE
jgi:hypothetical protein